MYCCWNRIPQRRGKWMIRSGILSLRLATIKNMRLIAFGTAQSMPGSQQESYQGSTIWSCGKATLRRRIPKNLHRRSSTFKGLLPPITRTIQRSRQRPSSPSIWLRQWLGHLFYPGQQSRNEADLLSLRRSWQRNVANQLGPPLPPSSDQISPKSLSCSILFRLSFLTFY